MLGCGNDSPRVYLAPLVCPGLIQLLWVRCDVAHEETCLRGHDWQLSECNRLIHSRAQPLWFTPKNWSWGSEDKARDP